MKNFEEAAARAAKLIQAGRARHAELQEVQRGVGEFRDGELVGASPLGFLFLGAGVDLHERPPWGRRALLEDVLGICHPEVGMAIMDWLSRLTVAETARWIKDSVGEEKGRPVLAGYKVAVVVRPGVWCSVLAPWPVLYRRQVVTRPLVGDGPLMVFAPEGEAEARAWVALLPRDLRGTVEVLPCRWEAWGGDAGDPYEVWQSRKQGFRGAYVPRITMACFARAVMIV